METKKAQVYQSTGSYYEIKDEEGQLWRARLKGRFKISKHASRSNPIAVGDWVKFDIVEKEDNEAIIDDILLDRKSTRLNSSHVRISYAVFCLKKKRKHDTRA